ncbi:hypothetical protein TNCV_2825301 [Trichonephila clavipes]|nr:hypothetical protein TNCV_2825301 [Trichonephila clavipes]
MRPACRSLSIAVLGYKMLEDVVLLKSMFPAVVIMVSLVERSLLRSEETGNFGDQPGKGRKRVTPVLVDAFKTAADVKLHTSDFKGSST